MTSIEIEQKQRMLKAIQVCEFNCLEAGLYLDTHKNDKDAIAYFKTQNELFQRITDEYIKIYGPLRMFESQDDDSWKWSDGPWPWENDAN